MNQQTFHFRQIEEGLYLRRRRFPEWHTRSALHIDSCNPHGDKCCEIDCTIVKNVIFDRLSIKLMPSDYDLSFLSKVDFYLWEFPLLLAVDGKILRLHNWQYPEESDHSQLDLQTIQHSLNFEGFKGRIFQSWKPHAFPTRVQWHCVFLIRPTVHSEKLR